MYFEVIVVLVFCGFIGVIFFGYRSHMRRAELERYEVFKRFESLLVESSRVRSFRSRRQHRRNYLKYRKYLVRRFARRV